MTFADNLDNKLNIKIDTKREVTQVTEQAQKSIRPKPEVVAVQDLKRLDTDQSGVIDKADRLKKTVEDVVGDLYLEVDNLSVKENLNRIFPGDARHAGGTILPFQLYKEMLEEIAFFADPTKKDIVVTKSSYSDDRSKSDKIALAYRGVSAEIAEAINNVFFAVHLAHYGLAFFNNPLNSAAIAASAPLNPPGGAAVLGVNLAEALGVLTTIGANLSYVQAFMDQLTGSEGANRDNLRSPVTTGTSFIQNYVDAYAANNKRIWAKEVLTWADTNVIRNLNSSSKYQFWAAYSDIESVRISVIGSREIVRERTPKVVEKNASRAEVAVSKLGSMAAEITPTTATYQERNIDYDSYKAKAEEFLADTINRASIIGANTADTAEAAVDFSTDLYNLFADESTDMNKVLDSMWAFMSTYYGPDFICCLARITGVSIDSKTLKAMSGMLKMLNAVNTFSLSSDKNKVIQDIEAKINEAVEKNIIAAIDKAFQKSIKQINRTIDKLSETGIIDVILSCGPVADLILLIKQSIIDLQNLLFDLVRDFIDRVGLRRINITSSASIRFEVTVAGKLARILDRLDAILSLCGDPTTEEGAAQLLERLDIDSPQISVVGPAPEYKNDPMWDFIDKTPFTTRGGLTYTPGVQTNAGVNPQDVLKSCIGLPGKTDLIKFAQQTNYLRDRYRDITNGI